MPFKHLFPFMLFYCSLTLTAKGQSIHDLSLDSLVKSCYDESIHDTLRAESYVLVSSKYTSIKMDTVEAICLEGIAFIHSIIDPNNINVAKKLLQSESVLLTNAGYAKYHMGDFDSALKYWYSSLNKKEMLKDRRGKSSVLNNIANLETDLGELQKAEANFEKALKIQIELNDSAAISKTYINLGYNKRVQGQDSLARMNYLKALSIKRQINDLQGIANCLNNIGFIHKKNGEYNEAIDHYNQSYGIYVKINSLYGKLASLNNLANCYYELGQNSKAKSFALRGYQLASENEMYTDLRYLTEILYKIYKVEGNYKAALNKHEEFITIKDSLYNQERYKSLIDQELKYEYEKKEQIKELNRLQEKELEEVKHQNELEIAAERTSRLVIILIVVSLGLITVIGLLLFIRKQKLLIEKQSKELELVALRSQMNPHFLFNSLNSIKLFIIENQKELSAKYLTKFSKLMRLILENSNKNLISLEEELEATKYYLELEQIRFNNKFDFEINNEADTLIELPPLVLQPYVENAIWHGIMHKEDQGKITINIKEIGTGILIEIQDNGVGRKRSAELKSGTEDKQSMGLDITQKRIQSLHEILGVQPTIEFVDLMEGQQAKGTLVKITIPYYG